MKTENEIIQEAYIGMYEGVEDAAALAKHRAHYMTLSDISTYSSHDNLKNSKAKLNSIKDSLKTLPNSEELTKKVDASIAHHDKLLSQVPQKLSPSNYGNDPQPNSNMSVSQQARRALRGSNFY